MLPRVVDGGAGSGEALGLIGPHIGQKASPLVWIVEVGGSSVAGGAFNDPERGGGRRRRAGPVGVEGQWCAAVAPVHVAKTIAVAVPGAVQSGAGPDFEAAQWQAGLGRDHKESARQTDRPANLIGLRLVGHEGGTLVADLRLRTTPQSVSSPIE